MSLDPKLRRSLFLDAMGIRRWTANHVANTDEADPHEVVVVDGDATSIDVHEAEPAHSVAASQSVHEVDFREPAAALLEANDSAAALVPYDATDVSERRRRIQSLDWSALRDEVAQCTACGLCKSRRQTVFGVGAEQADWMVIGEAPGAEEDARGEPFVGQAGRLLDNMLASLALARGEQVFIANVLKCRPPGNRDPQPIEVETCDPFLKRQIELVAPRIILVLGRFAAQSLLATDTSISKLRGSVHGIDVAGRRIPVIVTYHPAYLLRSLADKAKAWADLSLALDTYRDTERRATSDGPRQPGASAPSMA